MSGNALFGWGHFLNTTLFLGLWFCSVSSDNTWASFFENVVSGSPFLGSAFLAAFSAMFLCGGNGRGTVYRPRGRIY